jgi:hypothetical protein
MQVICYRYIPSGNNTESANSTSQMSEAGGVAEAFFFFLALCFASGGENLTQEMTSVSSVRRYEFFWHARAPRIWPCVVVMKSPILDEQLQ